MTQQTATREHDPSTCWICTRHAIAIGVGTPTDPRYLCKECIVAIDDLSRIKRPSAYELMARKGGMEAAGPLVEEFGSDLAEWDETQILLFVGAVWDGCAKEMRRLVRDGNAPF